MKTSDFGDREMDKNEIDKMMKSIYDQLDSLRTSPERLEKLKSGRLKIGATTDEKGDIGYRIVDVSAPSNRRYSKIYDTPFELEQDLTDGHAQRHLMDNRSGLRRTFDNYMTPRSQNSKSYAPEQEDEYDDSKGANDRVRRLQGKHAGDVLNDAAENVPRLAVAPTAVAGRFPAPQLLTNKLPNIINRAITRHPAAAFAGLAAGNALVGGRIANSIRDDSDYYDKEVLPTLLGSGAAMGGGLWSRHLLSKHPNVNTLLNEEVESSVNEKMNSRDLKKLRQRLDGEGALPTIGEWRHEPLYKFRDEHTDYLGTNEDPKRVITFQDYSPTNEQKGAYLPYPRGVMGATRDAKGLKWWKSLDPHRKNAMINSWKEELQKYGILDTKNDYPNEDISKFIEKYYFNPGHGNANIWGNAMKELSKIEKDMYKNDASPTHTMNQFTHLLSSDEISPFEKAILVETMHFDGRPDLDELYKKKYKEEFKRRYAATTNKSAGKELVTRKAYRSLKKKARSPAGTLGYLLPTLGGIGLDMLMPNIIHGAPGVGRAIRDKWNKFWGEEKTDKTDGNEGKGTAKE